MKNQVVIVNWKEVLRIQKVYRFVNISVQAPKEMMRNLYTPLHLIILGLAKIK
jgi:hypothetical protein